MAKYEKKLEEDIRCPLEYGLTVFGGKWKSRIICVLSAKKNAPLQRNPKGNAQHYGCGLGGNSKRLDK